MRIFIGLFLVFGIAAVLYFYDPSNNVVNVSTSDALQTRINVTPNVVFDISVHTVGQLRQVLERAESLASGPRSAAQPASISLMLHGQEINYFTIDKYNEYRDIVDLSAKLAAYNVIEFKMCETAMKDYGVKKSNIPSFIEFVPDGNVAIKTLSRQGYTIM